MSRQSAFSIFIEEAHELLDSMEAALLRISEGDSDPETLNELFRAAHTIKGSAGLFGLTDIVSFTHDVENIMGAVREGDIAIEPPLLEMLFKGRDHIGNLVQALQEGETISDELTTHGRDLSAQLEPWLKSEEALPEDVSGLAKVQSDAGQWHISVRMNVEVLRNGMDPLAIFSFLKNLGELTFVAVLDDLIPLDMYDPELLYLGFELSLKASCSKAEIEDAFMFVRDDAQLHIIPPNSSVEQYIEIIRASPHENALLGEILLECGAITSSELERALNSQQQAFMQRNVRKAIGEILVENASVSADVVDVAVSAQRKKKPTVQRSIRVDAIRLDKLINLIGELVISRQRIDLISERLSDVVLDEALTTLGSLTEQVQDAALNLRMVPVGETFQRFKRVVRDTAVALGKDIALVLVGEDTELDRSMVEKLVDPLTHIIRNAIDHGIEAPGQRRERGKPAQGCIRLAAYHDAGNIVIEVSDDGGGLNTTKIREKAVAKGLINVSQELSRYELHHLIFHPGFSTAEAVTNLSGRGVGMDVVRRNIEDLQGGVEIASEFGKGTTITLRLPLTLAIIEGFHVSASGTHFIIPRATIVECLDFVRTRQVKGGQKIDLRGELVPYIELHQLMGLPASSAERREIIIVQFGNDRAGIVVDELFGEIQTVVKPLNPIFSSLRGVGGSSLLGNGDIAFILDIPQLIQFAVSREEKRLQLHEGEAS